MTPIPAFEEAWVQLVSADPADDASWAAAAAATATALNAQRDSERVARLESRGNAIVAAAVPVVPPSSWFAMPEPDEPTPLTVDLDGRVYGHLASWGECHVGHRGCVQPPRSASDYAMFHTGWLDVEDDENTGLNRLRVGQVTFRTTHADDYASALSAAAHYENTGHVAADVRARDGEHGIWLCGALRPGLDPETYREVLAAAPSGDWRPHGQGMELINVLMVNAPGFMGPHRAAARAVTAGGSVRDGQLVPGQVTALFRLGYGFPREAGQLARRLARVEQLTRQMWEDVGRPARFAALTADVGRLATGERLAPAHAHAGAACSGDADCGCGCR